MKKSTKVIIFTFICCISAIAIAEENISVIRQIAFCRGIQDGILSESSDEFLVDKPTVCARVEFAETADYEVTLAWYYGPVKKYSDKTVICKETLFAESCINIQPESMGIWWLKVLDSKGKMTGEKQFYVKGIPDKPDRSINRRTAYADIGLKANVRSKMKLSSIIIGERIARGKIHNETKTASSKWKKVYCLIEVPGVTNESTIKFVWYYFKKKMAESVVEIEPEKNQVWSAKSLQPQYVGEWCVEILDENDAFINELYFEVK